MLGPPPVCRNCEYAYQPFGLKWFCSFPGNKLEKGALDPESPGCEDFNYSPEVIQ